jgi:hypothetical protein
MGGSSGESGFHAVIKRRWCDQEQEKQHYFDTKVVLIDVSPGTKRPAGGYHQEASDSFCQSED